MRRSDFDNLLRILACPNCYGSLLPEDISGGDEVLSGSLVCNGCSSSYPIRETVAYLIVPDASWKTVLQEVVSWKSYEVEQEFLKQTGRIDKGKPKAVEYHLQQERGRQAAFGEIFSRINIGSGITACEVAAFECKQALYVAKRQVGVVATDAWPEPMLLGSGEECRFIPKICCNAERMPFKNGSFDLTYERTSVHHFGRTIKAIREMSRVTRLGGKVVLVHEPSQFLFGSLMREKASGTEEAFLMGMHEGVPHFSTFLFALFMAGLQECTVYYYDACFPPAFKNVLKSMGLDSKRVLGNYYCGKSAKGWKLFKLLFVRCNISVISEKKAISIPTPKPVPKNRLSFNIDEFLDRRLENLTILWKRMLNRNDVARCIIVGKNNLYHLRRGWEKRENIFGYATCWTRYIAYVFLYRKKEDKVLEIECRAPVGRLGRPVITEVSIDGGPWSAFSLTSDKLVCFRFNIPDTAGKILEVKIRTPEPWRGSDVYPGKYDDRLFFGVAVRYLGMGK